MLGIRGFYFKEHHNKRVGFDLPSVYDTIVKVTSYHDDQLGCDPQLNRINSLRELVSVHICLRKPVYLLTSSSPAPLVGKLATVIPLPRRYLPSSVKSLASEPVDIEDEPIDDTLNVYTGD